MQFELSLWPPTMLGDHSMRVTVAFMAIGIYFLHGLFFEVIYWLKAKRTLKRLKRDPVSDSVEILKQLISQKMEKIKGAHLTPAQMKDLLIEKETKILFWCLIGGFLTILVIPFELPNVKLILDNMSPPLWKFLYPLFADIARLISFGLAVICLGLTLYFARKRVIYRAYFFAVTQSF